MKRLPPLLGRYFGSKWRSAPRYPEPKHPVIIEPFAGGAGYSLLYPNRQVYLIEKNPQIARIWEWLIAAPVEEIRALPIHEPGEKIHASVRGPARDWIGMWNAFGQVCPQEKMVPSAGAQPKFRNYFWNAKFRDRTAEAVKKIRHWLVYCLDYRKIPNFEATWFIDPPYKNLNHYRQGALNYDVLALWCIQREGQIIVCEQESATWLPFRSFAKLQAAPRANNRGEGNGRKSAEGICTWDSKDL